MMSHLAWVIRNVDFMAFINRGDVDVSQLSCGNELRPDQGMFTSLLVNRQAVYK